EMVAIPQQSQQQIQPADTHLSSRLEEAIAYLKRGEERAVKQDARMDAFERQNISTQARLSGLEKQIGAMASQMQNTQVQGLPSDTVQNPKHVNAITLKGGKQLGEPKPPVRKASPPEAEEQEISVEARKQGEETEIQEEEKQKEDPAESTLVRKDYVPGRIICSENLPVYVPKLPFPQRLQKKKDDDQFVKFLDMLKKLHINISFIETLEQIPKYVKYMKDVLTRKKKLEDLQTVVVTEECSAIIQHKLPPKQKDPGSFTIPCSISNLNFDKCLCDLGASINLMPYSVFQQLGLGDYEPTAIVLQLADKSTTKARGVIEDVMIRVGNFIYPADFVIVDMEVDKKVPLILGRPFLATGRALIDVEQGNVTLRFNDEKIEFNIFKSLKLFDDEKHECNRVEVINECVLDVLHACISSNHLVLEIVKEITGIENVK
ncbi:retropepsin-like aspartic protease, partial [Candidatus Burkholderia verschuerenii]|uniref:retropepsin-like aspartic protease n=1 Tax=Candidatus Burkholderia verschuerenii TaxID=242163 RepID=UPI0018DB8ECE